MIHFDKVIDYFSVWNMKVTGFFFLKITGIFIFFVFSSFATMNKYYGCIIKKVLNTACLFNKF